MTYTEFKNTYKALLKKYPEISGFMELKTYIKSRKQKQNTTKLVHVGKKPKRQRKKQV